MRQSTFSGRFLGIPATSRYEMGLKIFISSSSTSLYKFYGSILHVGGEITMGKTSKNVDFGSPLPATFPAKLAGTTYWALKPSPPGTQRHRSRPHTLPDGGGSKEWKFRPPRAFEVISDPFRSKLDLAIVMEIVAGVVIYIGVKFGDHRRWLIGRRVGLTRRRLWRRVVARPTSVWEVFGSVS